MTTISVAMATRNGARHLQDQLDSLAAQELLPHELHIGDDHSTDDTAAIVRKFATSAPFPVHLHENTSALGYGENFIQTAQRCLGEWIAFCDQDDVWLPGKLAYCASRIASGPADLQLVVHDAHVVDEQLRPVGRLLYDYPESAVHTSLTLPPEWHSAGFTEVFRGSLIHSVPTSPRVSFPWHEHREAHDVWIALLANALGSTLICGEPLASYRRHDLAVTASGSPLGLFARMKEGLQNQGPHYDARARYMRNAAAVLRSHAAHVEDASGQKLRRAAAKMSKQAEFFDRRAAVHCGRTFSARISALAALVAAGGYAGRQGWPFGIARLAKDFGHSLRPNSQPGANSHNVRSVEVSER